MGAPVIKRTETKGSFENFKALADAVALLIKGIFVKGRVVTFTDLVVGDNTVRHGLGRNPTTVVPTYQTSASSFCYAKSTTPETTFIINSSAIVTSASFYVD